VLFLVDLGLLKGYDASNSMITTMVRTNISECRILCLFHMIYYLMIVTTLSHLNRLFHRLNLATERSALGHERCCWYSAAI